MRDARGETAIGKVGFIGAGRMGQPMIGHVAAAGFDVSVYDIDPAKQVIVEQRKAKWEGDARALARSSDAILICVGFDRELRELFSPTGPLRDARRGTIVAVLSTVHPKTVIELAEQGSKRGIRLLDSTVCRGGKAADEGTLLSFVGGDADDVSRLRPVLASYSTDIVHTGGAGTAQVAKAANNMVMWACLIADHEALALAQRYGMDVEKLREALQLSSADNYVLRNWKVNTMAWAEDDMEIVQQMAADRGMALPQAGLNRELCRMLKPKRFKLDEYGV
jgi:3-hydroxyisobutyrate dehydrogenase-like beta-hydroxyacid dehydrogenase